MSTKTIDQVSTDITLGTPHKCILFNDMTHSTEEVSAQIVKATGFPLTKAMEIMLQAHMNGQAIVITAGLERCEHVSAVLEEIRLSTRVEPA